MLYGKYQDLKTSEMKKYIFLAILLISNLAACLPAPGLSTPGLNPLPTVTPPYLNQPTPLPARPTYKPGELVSYTAQNGDTLPALAAHFNTSLEEILNANPIIPADATTLPPGLPMEIPIYFRSYWGSPFKIVPDSHFINGPAAAGFDTSAFISQRPGWLKNYNEYAAGDNRPAADIIDYVALNFSVSPRMLLAVIEQQAGGLSDPNPPASLANYPLGYRSPYHRGLYLQLVWAANTLNNGYYGWRSGSLVEFDHRDGTIERPDPWQNAASVGVQNLYRILYYQPAYQAATGPEGFASTYARLFGNPWESDSPHIPGSLRQPELLLPFQPGKTWAYTGGPHTGWGSGAPLAGIDFAPSTEQSGCFLSNEWATALADGLVTRAEPGALMLDLDGDGDERTGWVIFYLHIEGRDLAKVGTLVKAGDPLGHPSCEGGTSTGTHIHMARKFNGEWLAADSALPFVLEGWTPHNGDQEYQGSLTRYGVTITACECATQETFIKSEREE